LAAGKTIVLALTQELPNAAELVSALGEVVIQQAVHMARVVEECVKMKEIVRQQRQGEFDCLREVEMTFAEMRNILEENDFLRERLNDLLKDKKNRLREFRQEDADFRRRTVEWREEMMKDVRIASVLLSQAVEGKNNDEEGDEEESNTENARTRQKARKR
jgi:hypothetical protein